MLCAKYDTPRLLDSWHILGSGRTKAHVWLNPHFRAHRALKELTAPQIMGRVPCSISEGLVYKVMPTFTIRTALPAGNCRRPSATGGQRLHLSCAWLSPRSLKGHLAGNQPTTEIRSGMNIRRGENGGSEGTPHSQSHSPLIGRQSL